MPKAPKAKVTQMKRVIHPNSRAAGVLQRQSHHDQKVLKSKSDTSIKMESLRQKLLWFQESMDQNKTTYTKHELAELTKTYMERFNDEVEQINIIKSVGNRQSKQHVARETAIKLTKEREEAEFSGIGVEVPDLVNGKYLEYFRNWTGEIKFFANIKMRRAKNSDIKEDVRDDDTTDETNTESEDLPEYIEETDD